MERTEAEAGLSAVAKEEDATLTLEDLLNAESEVLRRVGRNYGAGEADPTSAHFSSTGGHKMGSSHTSHTMASVERPLED